MTGRWPEGSADAVPAVTYCRDDHGRADRVASQTITPSARDYFDNRCFAAALGPGDLVDVPTAISVFYDPRASLRWPTFAADGR